MLVAHAASLIDPWGFAYTGAVLGAVTVGVVIVRREVAQRAEPAGTRPVWRIPRWWLVVGFVCGASFGLGLGRLLEHYLTDTPDPVAVVSGLCRAMEQVDGSWSPEPDLDDETDHLVRDLGSPALIEARARLDAALDGSASASEVRSAISELVTQIAHSVPEADMADCGTG